MGHGPGAAGPAYLAVDPPPAAPLDDHSDEGGTSGPHQPHATVVSVAAAVRQRIVTDKYVALGLLLDGEDSLPDQAPAFQLLDGLLRPMARTPRTITTFGVWSTAFLKYAAVYVEAHPGAAAGLLAHMRQVFRRLRPGADCEPATWDWDTFAELQR
ncbi:hypothetical protein FJT64_011411 [Amphibalanus amphitrite]|uniref:Uncharacterized protein n=1 Tax=Amphibalanus amphitrite TaxID=1232801 RepID=A0A6A4VJ52_AMPAM|nr:hypothetical protein FJT64_011411 [Amphibalanus amphitrite]